jgi:hypothetical protein
MRKEWIPSTVMLTAGAITILISIYRGYDAVFSLKRLLAVLIIFLIIGTFAKKALIKIEEATPPPEDAEKRAEDAEGNDSSNGENAEEGETSEKAAKTPDVDNTNS